MVYAEPIVSAINQSVSSTGALIRAILWSTLVAGSLDIAAAMAGVAARGAPAIQAVRAVASGWFGTTAFRGGSAYVAIGIATHFAIMLVIATLFCLAARSSPLFSKYWIATGIAYGAAVYLVMTYIVVPLSAFPGNLVGSRAAFLQGLIIHIVCVGLPMAFIARRIFFSPAAASLWR